MGRPRKGKVGSVFLDSADENSELAMSAVLGVDHDEAGLYGREFDDASDEEAEGLVEGRASRRHVVAATRVFFREPEPIPEAARAAAALGAGDAEERAVESVRVVDGERKSVVDYGVWLESQDYGDDLKFVNADFVDFTIGGAAVTLEQERGLGKGGHVWDGAYVLAEALLVLPPKALTKDGCAVLELGAGAGLAGLAVSLHYAAARVTLTDGDAGVMDLLKRNLARNASPASVKRLAWALDAGDAPNDQSDDAWKPKAPDGEAAAAGDPDPPVKFDVIIAAEAVAPIYDAKALVATLKRHAHATTEVRMVCKDGKWPDHAKFFYDLLGEHFSFTVSKPTTKLKATYFSLVTASLKKTAKAPPPGPPFGDAPCATHSANASEGDASTDSTAPSSA